MRCARTLGFVLVAPTVVACSPARTTPRQDASQQRQQPDARAQIVPVPDTVWLPPDAMIEGDITVDVGSHVTCPAPCPPQYDCRALFPNTTSGMCLKRCSAGCGPCGGPPGAVPVCSECEVVIGGTRYCLDYCWWKGTSGGCPDSANQKCVDAFSIPNLLLSPDYKGTRACVPK